MKAGGAGDKHGLGLRQRRISSLAPGEPSRSVRRDAKGLVAAG